MTDGQELAIEQLRDIAAVSGGLLEIIKEIPSGNEEGYSHVFISIRTGHIPRIPEGIQYRERERFLILIPSGFPFATPPQIGVRHTRFAGRPHVQWMRVLCLYQAPDVEWNPSDGMYGFIERLWEWLKRGALNELDPFGGPLHPPVAYLSKGPIRTVVPRVNTPTVHDAAWLGLASYNVVHDLRIDVVGWHGLSDEVTAPVGPAILLAAPMPFEYPSKLGNLFSALEHRGVPSASSSGLLCNGTLHARATSVQTGRTIQPHPLWTRFDCTRDSLKLH